MREAAVLGALDVVIGVGVLWFHRRRRYARPCLRLCSAKSRLRLWSGLAMPIFIVSSARPMVRTTSAIRCFYMLHP